ncbi:hypothetical protein FNV66_52990 [Streptomyces sp. S1D4-14]|nr:hypothetical protein FNV66_52990 [Streptomyces sp. S1D4-14]
MLFVVCCLPRVVGGVLPVLLVLLVLSVLCSGVRSVSGRLCKRGGVRGVGAGQRRWWWCRVGGGGVESGRPVGWGGGGWVGGVLGWWGGGWVVGGGGFGRWVGVGCLGPCEYTD